MCVRAWLHCRCAQTWDLRNPAIPVIRHAAHNALVLTLQYHPRWKDVIASGGRDTLVKVCAGG